MSRIGGWRKVAAAAAVAAACAMAAGCGGDASGGGADGGGSDTGAETPAAARAPQGQGEPETLASRVVELLVAAEGEGDCRAVEDVNSRSFAQLTCPPEPELRRSMRRFEVTGTATYGSAAVVDYRSGAAPEGASVVLFVGPDGRWALSRFGLLYGSVVETSDERSRAGFDRAAAGYLRAVRKRNCALFRRHAATDSTRPKQICEREFKTTAELGLAIIANGGAKPRYLGGNGTFGFYSVTLRRPRPSYVTLSVLKAGPGPQSFRVLDAAPGPAPEPAPGDEPPPLPEPDGEPPDPQPDGQPPPDGDAPLEERPARERRS